MPQKYYAVAVGAKIGVFPTWGETEPLVTGFSGAMHKRFNTLSEAQDYIYRNRIQPESNLESVSGSVETEKDAATAETATPATQLYPRLPKVDGTEAKIEPSEEDATDVKTATGSQARKGALEDAKEKRQGSEGRPDWMRRRKPPAKRSKPIGNAEDLSVGVDVQPRNLAVSVRHPVRAMSHVELQRALYERRCQANV